MVQQHFDNFKDLVPTASLILGEDMERSRSTFSNTSRIGAKFEKQLHHIRSCTIVSLELTRQYCFVTIRLGACAGIQQHANNVRSLKLAS